MTSVDHNGLTNAEAANRLKSDGFNELVSSKRSSALQILVDVFKEPMFILLVSCSVLYLIVGDTGEGIMLMSSVAIIIAITFYQQRRTEHALQALKGMSSPRALVIRDGKEIRIASREVVVGDILVLLEGDRISADATILSSSNLRVDESLLTGESVPVTKIHLSESGEPGMVYSGTLIVQGRGIAKVTSTGQRTKFGQIGELLRNIKEEPTLLHQETGRIVKIFSIVGFLLCAILVLVFGIVHHDWIRGLLGGLSLAMAMVPEEFAVVLTIFMALGAWKISKRNALTRKPAAIEALGAVTVLCSDKTGTITRNEMTVTKAYVDGKSYSMSERSSEWPGEIASMIRYSILACQRNPFDPMERAFHLLEKSARPMASLAISGVAEKEYPLSTSLLAVSFAYRKAGGGYLIASKGSPEAIAKLCHLPVKEHDEVICQTGEFATQGLRVLGVAYAEFKAEKLPEAQHEFDFKFCGIVGLEDPLRESVTTDLAACYDAGIRMIMITGDYPITAESIARQMGLKNPGESITGPALAKMDDKELAERIKHVNIFARVNPEQKLRIVNALKQNGEIVAMTGDGVNDAPSLKAAHIGIAMGQRGTDVAREAAALVLLDDNFSSIVAAIRMGRVIYDNMKKAMSYVFSVHIPIAGLTLIPVFIFGAPVIMMPLHIAFLELVIDPACTLIFEGERAEKNVMSRPPRKSAKPVFGTNRIVLSSIQGLSVLAVSLAVFFISMRLNRPPDEIRALTFTTLVMSNIGLILINRSWTRTVWQMFKVRNPAALWVTGAVAFFLLLVLYLPALRQVFHFDLLRVHDLAICVAASAISVTWFEVLKLVARSRRSHGNQ